MTEAISVEIHNDIAVVRFVRPKERNPLSIATLEELERQFISLSLRNDIRAIIFTGTEDIFASGADIKEIGSLTPETALAFSHRWQTFFQSIADSKIKTIAAINGYCMGGALDLVLSCKVRLATPNAVFAHPGLRLGIITGWGGTQRLSRLIGQKKEGERGRKERRGKEEEEGERGLISAVGESVLELALAFAN